MYKNKKQWTKNENYIDVKPSELLKNTKTHTKITKPLTKNENKN